jgi:hypothetical protein
VTQHDIVELLEPSRGRPRSTTFRRPKYTGKIVLRVLSFVDLFLSSVDFPFTRREVLCIASRHISLIGRGNKGSGVK